MENISDSLREAGDHRDLMHRRLKISALGVISAILILAVWWTINQALFDGNSASYWTWPVLLTTLWICFLSFFVLTNKNPLAFLFLNLFGLISYLLIMPRDLYVLLGGVIFFLLSLIFQSRIQAEEKNQLNFSIRRTLASSQMVITYAFLILIGFLIYYNTNQEFKQNPDAFYQKIGENAIQSFPMFKEGSRFDFGQTLDEFLFKQAQEDNPRLQTASPTERQRAVDEARAQFEQQFGTGTEGNRSLKVIVTEIVSTRVREALGQYEKFFPLIFTLIIVTVLRFFAFLFNILTLLLSWAIFYLFKSVKFFKLKRVPVEVEKLTV